MKVVDLFAGPGGWDLPARELGLEVLGIEWDDAACATREAAGLWTLQTDVGALDPRAVLLGQWARGAFQPDGLIASPPCQAFSMAGKGAGRKALDAYAEQCARMAYPEAVAPLTREQLDELCHDERAHLVLEPLRWALALRPRWVALEQVRPVLPVWEAMAEALRAHGYATWTGVLSAERYGVPQTRERAILLASLDGSVGMPEPTHQRYVAPRRRDEATLGLFEAPEPERIVHPEDRDLLPWVSMADALGWDRRDRRVDQGRAVAIDGELYRARDLRHASQPGLALTEKARSAVRFRANAARPNAAERSLDEPAQTLAFGHNPPRWVRFGNQDHSATRAPDEPAATLRFSERLNAIDKVDEEGQTVRVTIEEALILQSFPPDYPVQGSKTKMFEQVGNAIPPLLALACLREVVG